MNRMIISGVAIVFGGFSVVRQWRTTPLSRTRSQHTQNLSTGFSTGTSPVASSRYGRDKSRLSQTVQLEE